MPSTETLALRLDSIEDTRSFGSLVGACCEGGEVILLEGALGAGKTCFTQGLAVGLGVPEQDPVTSPTYVLHVQYEGRLTLNHLDAYRLENAPDAAALGFDEFFGHPEEVAAVEWPDRLASILPEDRLRIRIDIEGGESRRFALHAQGAVHASLARRIRDAVENSSTLRAESSFPG